MQAKIDQLKARIQAGVLPAMATPFEPDSIKINDQALHDLINFLIEVGVKGLFIGGTTGEGILLPLAIRQHLHQVSVSQLAGRLPALIHVGANNTEESMILAQHAEEIRADAVVAVTPYFYPIHDDALFEHYRSIATASSNTPLMLYDIPHMAVNGIQPSLVERMLDEIPSFAGWKSSNPDSRKVRSLIDTTPGDKIRLVGNEAVALGNLALGADGLISGLATAVPEPFVRLVNAFFSGDISEARLQQRIINEMLSLLPSGARIGAIKKILQQRGVSVGNPVPPRPLPPLDWRGWAEISGLLT